MNFEPVAFSEGSLVVSLRVQAGPISAKRLVIQCPSDPWRHRAMIPLVGGFWSCLPQTVGVTFDEGLALRLVRRRGGRREEVAAEEKRCGLIVGLTS